MTPSSVPPMSRLTLVIPSKTQTISPPPLWNHLDVPRKRQLAQHLARLIRRILFGTNNQGGDSHERL